MTESLSSASEWFKNNQSNAGTFDLPHLHNVFLHSVCRELETPLSYAYAFFDISRYMKALAGAKALETDISWYVVQIEPHLDKMNDIVYEYGVKVSEEIGVFPQLFFVSLIDDLKTIGIDSKVLGTTAMRVRLAAGPT